MCSSSSTVSKSSVAIGSVATLSEVSVIGSVVSGTSVNTGATETVSEEAFHGVIGLRQPANTDESIKMTRHEVKICILFITIFLFIRKLMCNFCKTFGDQRTFLYIKIQAHALGGEDGQTNGSERRAENEFGVHRPFADKEGFKASITYFRLCKTFFFVFSHFKILPSVLLTIL